MLTVYLSVKSHSSYDKIKQKTKGCEKSIFYQKNRKESGPEVIFGLKEFNVIM